MCPLSCRISPVWWEAKGDNRKASLSQLASQYGIVLVCCILEPNGAIGPEALRYLPRAKCIMQLQLRVLCLRSKLQEETLTACIKASPLEAIDNYNSPLVASTTRKSPP
eukprot:g19059.t1